MAKGGNSVLVSYESDLTKENLVDIRTLRSEKRKGLLEMCQDNGSAWRTDYVQVPNKAAYFGLTTVNTTFNSSTTTIVLDNLAVFPVLIKPSHRILNGAGELILVGSATTDVVYAASTITLTNCTRGAYSSTAVGATAADQVEILSAAWTENSSFVSSDHTESTRQVFFTQIYKYELEISGTADAMSSETINGDANIQTQIQEGLDHLDQQLQGDLIQMIHSGTGSTNSTTGIYANRNLRGLKSWIASYSGYTLSVGGALTTTILDNVQEQLLKRGAADDVAVAAGGFQGGSAPFVLLCNGTVKKSLNSLNASRVRVDQNERRIVNNSQQYVGAFGMDIMVVPDNVCRSSEAYIFRKDQIVCAPLQKRAFKVEPLAKTKDGMQYHIIGEYGVWVKNPETCARLYSIS